MDSGLEFGMALEMALVGSEMVEGKLSELELEQA